MKTLSENEKNIHSSILSEKSSMPNSSYTVITALYKSLACKDKMKEKKNPPTKMQQEWNAE